MPKNTLIARTLGLLLLAANALQAQVPQLINYQGRVAVNGVNFDGSGQFKFALIDAAGTTTVWSNDGTSIAGSEPAAAVAAQVAAGQYSVLLGDTSMPNMAAIPAGILDPPEVFVRVWFNDGTNGSQLLVPDQRLATGGGGPPVEDAWQYGDNGWPPSARAGHTAVWTGSEMIVWGGTPDFFSVLNTGGRYRPAGDSWTATTTVGAPAARTDHTAVWTGSEMIVWGGSDGTSYFNDTFSYSSDRGSFDFTSVSLDAGTLTLRFPTATGRTYTLWRSDTLAGGTWTNTGLIPLAGTGATLTFTVPVTTASQRFFRVHAD